MSMYHCEICDQDRDGDLVDASIWAGGIACDECIAEATESALEKVLSQMVLKHLIANWKGNMVDSQRYICGWLRGFAWQFDILADDPNEREAYHEALLLARVAFEKHLMEQYDV